MKKQLILVFVLFSSICSAQLRFFIDIPKVDGELLPVANRFTLTKSPKEKSTKINSFSFSSSKSIYLSSNLAVQKNSKSEDFQPIQIDLPLDKSITEWHDRIFKGTVMPALDIFVDKIGSSSVTELVHIKLTNVRVKDVSFVQSTDQPSYRVTLSYEKIIYASSKLNTNGTLNSVTQTCYDLKNSTPCTETL